MQTGAATMENSVEIPQKNKIRSTICPSNCTSGYLPKKYKNTKSKKTKKKKKDRSYSLDRGTQHEIWFVYLLQAYNKKY